MIYSVIRVDHLAADDFSPCPIRCNTTKREQHSSKRCVHTHLMITTLSCRHLSSLAVIIHILPPLKVPKAPHCLIYDRKKRREGNTQFAATMYYLWLWMMCKRDDPLSHISSGLSSKRRDVFMFRLSRTNFPKQLFKMCSTSGSPTRSIVVVSLAQSVPRWRHLKNHGGSGATPAGWQREEAHKRINKGLLKWHRQLGITIMRVVVSLKAKMEKFLIPLKSQWPESAIESPPSLTLVLSANIDQQFDL